MGSYAIWDLNSTTSYVPSDTKAVPDLTPCLPPCPGGGGKEGEQMSTKCGPVTETQRQGGVGAKAEPGGQSQSCRMGVERGPLRRKIHEPKKEPGAGSKGRGNKLERQAGMFF